jgi:hypothetical protein
VTNADERAEFEAEFAADARRARESLEVALAELGVVARAAIEAALSAEYRAGADGTTTREQAFADVRVRNESTTQCRRAVERVASACWVRL